MNRGTPSILGPFGPLFRYFRLVAFLVWTEIKATYVRSVLGLFWIVLIPIFYVSVFVFVRLYIFERTAQSPDWMGARLGISDIQMMALQMFAGFIVFWQASEVLQRATGAVRRQTVYVRDSVFPVEVLPWVTIGNAVFNLLVRSALFVIAFGVLVGGFPLTALLFPVTIAPLLLMMIGLAYAFAAIGVFARDLDFVIGAVMTGLLLLSAVLYPVSEVPENYQAFVVFNPIAMAIDQARQVVLLGGQPDWSYLGVSALVGLLMAWSGFLFYRILRPRFADAL